MAECREGGHGVQPTAEGSWERPWQRPEVRQGCDPKWTFNSFSHKRHGFSISAWAAVLVPFPSFFCFDRNVPKCRNQLELAFPLGTAGELRKSLDPEHRKPHSGSSVLLSCVREVLEALPTRSRILHVLFWQVPPGPAPSTPPAFPPTQSWARGNQHRSTCNASPGP